MADIGNVTDFGADNSGVSDSTAAINACIAAHTTSFFPDGTYKISGAGILPRSGTAMVGWSGVEPGSPSLPAISGPKLVAATGTDTIIQVSGITGVSIQGLILDGANTGANGISAGSICLYLDRILIQNCALAIGGSSSDTYSHAPCITNFRIQNNSSGLKNPIDGSISDGTFISNTGDGAFCGNGSLTTTFSNVRFEFNRGAGINSFPTSSLITLNGCFFDHNNKAGVRINGGTEWVISGCKFRRNGRTNSGADVCHIELDSASKVSFTGTITQTGQEDGGTGSFTPKYIINFTGANSAITFAGGDLSGFTAGLSTGTDVASYVGVSGSGIGIGNATTPSSFSATKYLPIQVDGVTYYLPASTAIW